MQREERFRTHRHKMGGQFRIQATTAVPPQSGPGTITGTMNSYPYDLRLPECLRIREWMVSQAEVGKAPEADYPRVVAQRLEMCKLRAEYSLSGNNPPTEIQCDLKLALMLARRPTLRHVTMPRRTALSTNSAVLCRSSFSMMRQR